MAGLVSALALFNALLLAYSRVPLAMADDGLLPRPLAKTDARGTPVNAVLVSAACYSVFALLLAAGAGRGGRAALRAARSSWSSAR